ncbi:hypothetical protein [Mesorhizobium sp. CN2-181]
MTVSVALQARPQFDPAAHALLMADPLIIGSSELNAISRERFGNRRA